MGHNLISLSFISQRSTQREETRIIAFMFCFSHDAEQITNVPALDAFWENLWISIKKNPGQKHRQLEKVSFGDPVCL